MPKKAISADLSLDLKQEIKNPDLVRALERLVTDTSIAAKNELLKHLQGATFLVAVLSESLKFHEKEEGKTILARGSHLDVLTAENEEGLTFLPLFTDWQQLNEYTDLGVSGWVLPAQEAWAFAMQDPNCEGAVINPAGNPLPIGKPMLEFLIAAEAEADA